MATKKKDMGGIQLELESSLEELFRMQAKVTIFKTLDSFDLPIYIKIEILEEVRDDILKILSKVLKEEENGN